MHAIFLRHASRAIRAAAEPWNENLADPALFDGALSERGRQEALAVAKASTAVTSGLPAPTQILCSPKKRARETVAPIAAAHGLAVEILPELDERGDGESGLHFDARVRGFVDELHSAFLERDAVWICSHLDWLEKALLFLPSDLGDRESAHPFSCAEARPFVWRDGLWRSAPAILREEEEE